MSFTTFESHSEMSGGRQRESYCFYDMTTRKTAQLTCANFSRNLFALSDEEQPQQTLFELLVPYLEWLFPPSHFPQFNRNSLKHICPTMLHGASRLLYMELALLALPLFPSV